MDGVLAGTSTLLCWCDSQSHWIGLSALELVCDLEPGPMAQAGIALGPWPVGLERMGGGWIDGLVDWWVGGWVDGWVGGWVGGWMVDRTPAPTARPIPAWGKAPENHPTNPRGLKARPIVEPALCSSAG